MDTDAHLVDRVRRGDRNAADVLAERYLRACRAVALGVLRSVAEADDVAQEAMIASLEQIDSCRNPARYAAWLFQITRNRARDVLKSKRYADMSMVDADLVQPALQDRYVEQSETRELLLQALEQLPDQHREALLLHDLEGWKHHEIARLLDIPHGTVRSHVCHARQRLRTLLAGWRVPEDA